MHIRIDRATGETEKALAWWYGLTPDEKAQWLQCAATPNEVDRYLCSPYPEVKATARAAAVGDAWLVYQASIELTS